MRRFRALLRAHRGGKFQGSYVCACPGWENERGENLLALVGHTMLPRILERLLSEREFMSLYGVHSVSRIHAKERDLGVVPGIGRALIEYVPGESTSGLLGGNSNWRGPIWMPINYSRCRRSKSSTDIPATNSKCPFHVLAAKS